jgi:sugar (pentulose or hexulose) kinase
MKESNMYFIGLDIGTTGAKAILTDRTGAVVGKGYCGYPLICDGPKVEQNPDDWTQCGSKAIRKALAGVDARLVKAVSLSAQGASTAAVRRDGTPLGNALTWMDSQARSEADELERSPGNDYIYRHTGWRVSPALDAAKIMRLKRKLPNDCSVMFLSTLEYLNLFLTGCAVCDPSSASSRQLFDIRSQKYDEKILAAAGIQPCELPAVLPAAEFVGQLTKNAALATGLRQGTPVFNGAHDQYCASIGTGAIQNGEMLLSTGTTWVVMGVSDHPVFSNTFIAPGVHPVGGLYGNITSLAGSGSSMQWFKEQFAGESFAAIDAEAAKRAEKARGLFYYPYPTGAYYPIWNASVRAAFTGIALEHDRYDFARSIMEGVAFSVRRTLEDFRLHACSIQQLRIVGGASKSSLWCGIIAAAAGLPLRVSSEPDACALGAAIVAAVGSGTYPSFQAAISQMSCPADMVSPDSEAIDAFNSKYAEYRRMRECLLSYYQAPTHEPS